MWTTPKAQDARVLSYIALRKAIGVIGFALPVVLIVGKMWWESPGFLPTLSDYYHSVMRDWWVGGLWAIGIFLFSYRFTLLDDILGDIAGTSAIGLALVPNTPDSSNTGPLGHLAWLHFTFSVSFLVALAIFALVLFPRTDTNTASTPQKNEPPPRKRVKNVVYVACGLVMVACLVLIPLIGFIPDTALEQSLHPYLWLESLIVWAFGIAWFVKGTEK
jgi:hypothetical protein